MEEYDNLQRSNKGNVSGRQRKNSKDYDLLNLMMLSAFDNSLANTRGN